jgi:hypothetical protein
VVAAALFDRQQVVVVRVAAVQHICQVRLLRVQQDKVLRVVLAQQADRLAAAVVVRVLLVRQAL